MDDSAGRAHGTKPMVWTFGTMVTRDMLVQPADGGEPRLWLLPADRGPGDPEEK